MGMESPSAGIVSGSFGALASFEAAKTQAEANKEIARLYTDAQKSIAETNAKAYTEAMRMESDARVDIATERYDAMRFGMMQQTIQTQWMVLGQVTSVLSQARASVDIAVEKAQIQLDKQSKDYDIQKKQLSNEADQIALDRERLGYEDSDSALG